jgi:beta-phosphoglucomutase-like phosphatase (HAD superfamily)
MVRFDRSHGRAPAAVLRDLFDGDEPRAQAALLAFERSFRATAQRFGLDVPVDVADAMGKTAGSGAKICLLTMLSRRSCGELLGLLQAADLVLCGDDAPRGFPWPDPVLTAMLRLGAADVREVAVVSATPDGVLSGYRAGARVLVGVGSGRRATALLEAGATHVLDSITTLPDLVAEASSAN